MTTKINVVPRIEQFSIVECLFRYLRTLDSTISIEYFNNDNNLCAKFPGNAQKLKENIIGGYTAELYFDMYAQNNVDDNRKVLDLIQELNNFSKWFQLEERNEFQTLQLPNGYTPMMLEMETTPEDISGKENNIATFVAMFKLTYRKKGGH